MVSMNKRDVDWQVDALCLEAGAENFFPEVDESPNPAKKVCAQCPVQEQCLAYALLNKERHGIWGGTTVHDRRKLWAKVDRLS